MGVSVLTTPTPTMTPTMTATMTTTMTVSTTKLLANCNSQAAMVEMFEPRIATKINRTS